MLTERGGEGQIVSKEGRKRDKGGRGCIMLRERGRKGQIVSREVRKQWREGKEFDTQMERVR
jgi:hypothetical protein